jgi:hypothetical protein
VTLHNFHGVTLHNFHGREGSGSRPVVNITNLIGNLEKPQVFILLVPPRHGAS